MQTIPIEVRQKAKNQYPTKIKVKLKNNSRRRPSKQLNFHLFREAKKKT